MNWKKMTGKELYSIIGQNVKYYRLLYTLNKEKLTQEKLAELVDVSTTVIGGLESEKANQGISVLTLYKISKALGVSMDELVTKRK